MHQSSVTSIWIYLIKRGLFEFNFKALINIWDIFLNIEIDKTHYETIGLEKHKSAQKKLTLSICVMIFLLV